MGKHLDLGKAATRSDIEQLFWLLLGRRVGDDAYARAIESTGVAIGKLAQVLLGSEEFKLRFASGPGMQGERPIQDLDFAKPVTQADVEELFRLILERDVGNDEFRREIEASGITVRDFARALLYGDEFAQNFAAKLAGMPPGEQIRDLTYRVPGDLERRPDHPKKVLLIGSCLMDQWVHHISNYNQMRGAETIVERINVNNASALPELDAAGASEYDFQIVQIPIRAVLPDAYYFGLRHTDDRAYQELFDHACQLIELNLQRSLEYNRKFGMTSFVLNFMTPQQNPAGRLLERYSLSNMVFFIEELNRHLWNVCAGYGAVYVIDLEEILSNYGKRYFQDDSTINLNHGSVLTQLELVADDERRLEPLGDVSALYAPKIPEYIAAIYHEIVGAYRSIRQQDSIKVVIFDLDDTLWRGVGADADEIEPAAMTEGWPLGVLEAAAYLWRRGVLIALISKNFEENVNRIWCELYETRFPLKNFIIRKINWEPKAQNIGEILQALNLLPGNALFVDDNPVERAAVKEQFPEIRILEAPVATWRRILLWAPETQRAVVTEESALRTDMVHAQIERDEARRSKSHAEFLESLDVRVATFVLRSREDRKYERCFELLNKTNQFNTTGKRWSPAEMHSLLAGGGYLVGAEVKDRYTAYGVVGVAVVSRNCIEQFVMSCRVFGMDVEIAILARILEFMTEGGTAEIAARLVPTDRNKLCLGLYKNCGFRDLGNGLWVSESGNHLAVPAHVQAEPLRDAGDGLGWTQRQPGIVVRFSLPAVR